MGPAGAARPPALARITSAPSTCGSSAGISSPGLNSPALSDASFGSIRSPGAGWTVDVRTHAPELGEEIAGKEQPFDPAVVSSYSCHGVEPGRNGTQDKINQDCAIVSHPYCADPLCAFFGVFDGHGQDGEVVSTAVMDFVVADLEARLLRDVQISAAISQAYEAANVHLAREHFKHANHSGACAATVRLQRLQPWAVGGCQPYVPLPNAQCPMPSAQRAQCPVPNPQPPMPNAQSPTPNAQCPVPSAQCPVSNAQ